MVLPLGQGDTSTRSAGGIAVCYLAGYDKLVRRINHVLVGIAGVRKAKLSYSDVTQKVSLHMAPHMTQYSGSMGTILGLGNTTGNRYFAYQRVISRGGEGEGGGVDFHS